MTFRAVLPKEDFPPETFWRLCADFGFGPLSGGFLERNQSKAQHKEKVSEDHEKETDDGKDKDDVDDDQDDEFDPDLEERVCALWDASADSSVAWFLVRRAGAIRVLCPLILRKCEGRRAEICLGIIGNLLSHAAM